MNNSFTAFQVPTSDVMPSEGMIDWLQKLPINWDGDESGVTLEPVYDSGEWVIASPGDWIVEGDGVYDVMNEEQFKLAWIFSDMRASQPPFTVDKAVAMIKKNDTVMLGPWVITKHDDDSPIAENIEIDGLVFFTEGDYGSEFIDIGSKWIYV